MQRCFVFLNVLLRRDAHLEHQLRGKNEFTWVSEVHVRVIQTGKQIDIAQLQRKLEFTESQDEIQYCMP